MGKVTCHADALNEALGLASILVTKGTDQSLLVRVDAAKDTATVFVSDGLRKLSANFPVSGSTDITEGELESGDFVIPADKIANLKLLSGFLDITYESKDGAFQVAVESVTGATSDFVTVDPKTLTGEIPAMRNTAKATFPLSVLREAISATKEYCVQDVKAAECPQKTIQLFDGSLKNDDGQPIGDGVVFATDRQRAVFFQSDSLKGKPLSLHLQHFGAVSAFLAKAEGQDLTCSESSDGSMTFLFASAGDSPEDLKKASSLGWVNHQDRYTKFAFYDPEDEDYILATPVIEMVKAVKYVKSGIGTGDRVRLMYSSKDAAVTVLCQEKGSKVKSSPVTVKPLGNTQSSDDFAFNVSANFLLGLFSSVRGNEVNFQVAVRGDDAASKTAVFRTVEKFQVLDNGKVSYEPGEGTSCQVIRLVPSQR